MNDFAIGRSVMKSVALSLTPALSRWERENRRRALVNFGWLGLSHAFPPSYRPGASAPRVHEFPERTDRCSLSLWERVRVRVGAQPPFWL